VRAQLESGGETIDDAFGAQWDTSIGRVDSDSPDPEGRIPPPGASTAEIKARAQSPDSDPNLPFWVPCWDRMQALWVRGIVKPAALKPGYAPPAPPGVR